MTIKLIIFDEKMLPPVEKPRRRDSYHDFSFNMRPLEEN